MAMEEAGITFFDVWRWIAGAAIAVIAFFLKRIIGAQDSHSVRLDVLERNTVSTGSHERSLDKLESKMDSHRSETNKSFERVFERLDNISDRLPK